MREGLTSVLRILIGFGTGTMLAGGIVSFITIIGVVPLMSYRTKTKDYTLLYENAIAVGSILGSILTMWTLTIKVAPIINVIFGFACGNFAGVLIIALAEILDVMPIMDRRIKLKEGIAIIVYAFAAGKLVGGLYYYLYPIVLEIMD